MNENTLLGQMVRNVIFRIKYKIIAYRLINIGKGLN